MEDQSICLQFTLMSYIATLIKGFVNEHCKRRKICRCQQQHELFPF